MNIERIIKESFTVIGKEGSTEDGEGFIQRLWDAANSNFGEIEHLAKRDENGELAGIWGAMSDLSRSFKPWDDFNKGLYLAGAECVDGAEAPEGWVKWVVPGAEFIRFECDGSFEFSQGLDYLRDNGLTLAGAVNDFAVPSTGKNYMMFPVRRL